MAHEIDPDLRERAVKMLRNGDTFAKIKEQTHLRYKDIKRIQRSDINPYFK
jgi:uncharacterized protein YerC